MITNEDNVLICPLCGSEYTHFIKWKKYYGKDGRLCVKLLFFCEEGHDFCIDFKQHEGFTIVSEEAV
jgi:hypothetical protein